MNTSQAATAANVTAATICNWARRGAITATKQHGRWDIDAASLARRAEIAGWKQARRTPVRSRDLDIAIGQEAAQASYCNSAAGLHAALVRIEARDADAFLYATGVRIPETQWNDLADFLRREIGHLDSERRTQDSIYDYS